MLFFYNEMVINLCLQDACTKHTANKKYLKVALSDLRLLRLLEVHRL